MALWHLSRARTADGIAHHAAGAGSPVVLAHGVGLKAESWGRQIPELAVAHAVYAVDLPGHGGSAIPGQGTPDLCGYAESLRRFVRDTVGEPPVLVGHSFGAMVALRLACETPDVCRGVAALNMVYRRDPEAKAAVLARAAEVRQDPGQDIVSGPIRRWFGTDPAGSAGPAAELCRQWLTETDRAGYARAYSVFAEGDAPEDDALAALPVPALFLTGEGDANSTAEMSRAMAEIAPHGGAVVVKHAGHMAMMTHPAEVTRELLAFCERCPPRLAGRIPKTEADG